MSEQSMALFLAQKMGLPMAVMGENWPGNNAVTGMACDTGVFVVDLTGRVHLEVDGESNPFDPATNKAQLMDCILWAARELKFFAITNHWSECWPDSGRRLVDHDGTDESVMRATVEAIAKAAGYEEPSHE